MPLPRASGTLYRVLIGVFGAAVVYQTGVTVAVVEQLRDSLTSPRLPLQFGYRLNVISGLTAEAQAAGLHLGDAVTSFDGKPFTSFRVFEKTLNRKRPGDSLTVVAQRPLVGLITGVIRVAPIRANKTNLAEWLITLAVSVLMPFACLALGFWVTAARTWDRNAWILLGLMVGFSQFTIGFPWIWPLRPAAFVWHTATGTTSCWLVWIVLFAIYFPEQIRLDRRHPGWKWILLGPLIALCALTFWVDTAREYNFAWAAPIRLPLQLLIAVPIEMTLGFAAISAFFALIFTQGSIAVTPDARRRMRILYFGTSASLTPMFIAAIYSLFRHGEVFDVIPNWAIIIVLLALLLFPLTLAYVIVVQRAMEVSMVLRQGLRYALARRSVYLLRASIIVAASVYLSYAFKDSQPSAAHRVLAVAFMGGAILLRRRFSESATTWVDRRFFREAYNAEIVLGDLSTEVRQFTDAHQLLSTVARRISGTLHVDRMAVFVRDGDRFCVRETVGQAPFSAYCLPSQSESVRLLTAAVSPEFVYFDDPRSWVHTAEADEQQKLRDLDAEVLLALPGRDGLLGLIALGPKLSEEPYSSSDLRLLQLVASHTGFALENAQLVATVARETATRERLNREIEIAREVQERLFPQNPPPVHGIDYCGHCRPALAVGGDYYDFLLRPGNRFGIALGDVSGKGISAALMMASLHSLLRGQTEAGLDDLPRLLQNTNRLIYESSTSNRYITFFYSEYDTGSRLLKYVNAGHNAPIVLRGDRVHRLEACGPVIGLLRDIQYEQAEFQFQPGDIFLIYTDGISEAMTVDDEEWGEERLIETAGLARDRCSEQILSSVFAAADAFTAGAKQYDDMTIIVARVL